jgi:hypothetical protein
LKPLVCRNPRRWDGRTRSSNNCMILQKKLWHGSSNDSDNTKLLVTKNTLFAKKSEKKRPEKESQAQNNKVHKGPITVSELSLSVSRQPLHLLLFPTTFPPPENPDDKHDNKQHGDCHPHVPDKRCGIRIVDASHRKVTRPRRKLTQLRISDLKQVNTNYHPSLISITFQAIYTYQRRNSLKNTTTATEALQFPRPNHRGSATAIIHTTDAGTFGRSGFPRSKWLSKTAPEFSLIQ